MSMYQVPFIAAANVPVPPVGEVILFFDLSNSNRLSRKDSSGTVVDLQSGASYTDADAVNAINTEILSVAPKPVPAPNDFLYLRDVDGASFKQVTKNQLQQLNPMFFSQVATDFIETVTGDFTAFTNGSAASNQNSTYGQDLTENAVGVTESDTGTTATGRAAIGLITGLLLRPTWGRFKYTGRHAVNVLSDLANTYTLRLGLYDGYNVAGDGTNGLYFRYTDLQNGGRWECVSRAGGVDLIAVDSGVSPDLDYHLYEVELNAAGSQAIFKIDGNLVATINTPNLPVAANPFGAGFKIEKSVGTTQRNFYSDFLAVEIERSTLR